MPKYICKNKKCQLCGIEKGRDTKISFIDGKLFDSGTICPECGEVCLGVKEKGFTTNFRGSRNICTK